MKKLLFVTFILLTNAYCAGIKAYFFNSAAENEKSRPDEVIRESKVTQGEIVADLGSGGGYYTFRFSKEVGESGKVFAVDVNVELLDLIKKNAEEKNIKNIIVTKADKNGVNLQENSIDLIFCRDVYHHLSGHEDYFRNLKKAAKKGGRLIIIDYLPKPFWSFHNLTGHYTLKETIRETLEKSGWIFDSEKDFLEEQSFQIFKN